MIDEFAKEYLHDSLRWVRETLLSKVEGLPEYDVRRPLTHTGTNLLGLIKHLTITEARYLGRSSTARTPTRSRASPTPATRTATTCGSPNTSPARRSSPTTTTPANTLTQPSTRSRSTPAPPSRGGRDPT